MSTKQVKRAAWAVAQHIRLYPDDTGGEQDLRRELAATRIVDFIERVTADSPPLDQAARDRISALLNERAVS